MSKQSKKDYRKLAGQVGIYKHHSTKNYLAMKRIEGKVHQKTFPSLFDAKKWRQSFDGTDTDIKCSSCSTLDEVWKTMQRVHFPMLATTTKAIWLRRYEPWKKLEHLHMDEITPSRITKFVQGIVEYYKSDYYQTSGRGRASRCNLNNELNLIRTIFNWYKREDFFESESSFVTVPIRDRHKRMAFIKNTPTDLDKKKISLEDAYKIFDNLPQLYRDLAMVQFFCAGRIGEIAGIQISNIDLDNDVLILRESISWSNSSKVFEYLKPFPKNRQARSVHIHEELRKAIQRRLDDKRKDCNYLFHVNGKPLNYCTIQSNYRAAQRKAQVAATGTHCFRHGMATLTRKVGGPLDAVMAITGHKDAKLADHYSKIDSDCQKETSLLVLRHIESEGYISPKKSDLDDLSNVIPFHSIKECV